MIHSRGRNVSRRYEKKISWLFCFLFCFASVKLLIFWKGKSSMMSWKWLCNATPGGHCACVQKKVKALMEVLRYHGKPAWFRSNKPAKLLGRFEWNRPERREMPGWSNEAAGWRQLSRHFCCIGRKKEETRNKQRKNIRNAMLGKTNLFCKIKERDKIHVAPKY